MKRSIKSVIAAAAAAFMCTAPAMASVPFVPAVNTITASAYYIPNAFEDFDDNWTPEITDVKDLTKIFNLGHVDYKLDTSNNTAMIKGMDKADSRIKIPAKLKVNNTYYYITSIDNHAFQGKNGKKDGNNPAPKGAALTKIDLSAAKYLETIGQEAFKDCTSLSTVTIPASVKTIDTKAFMNTGLQSVKFENTSAYGNKTLVINQLAFSDCTSLRTITNNVRNFGNSNSDAFNGCKKNLITVNTSYSISNYRKLFINNFKSKFGF